MNKMVQNFIKALSVIALTGATGVSEAQTPPTLNWSQAGPVYTAGRARNIVVDKADPTGSTLYCGSASSGIFKTTDAGVNWAPVNDQAAVRNISYMAQDVNNVIWVATGEGFLRYGQKQKAQRGTGLYKLTGNDLGNAVVDSFQVGAVINRIACSPTDASKMALATNFGIMISTNGGQTFANAIGITSNTNVLFGMDVKFDGNGILWCTVGNERGNHAPFTTVNSKVYKSTDASLTNFQDKTPVDLTLAPSNNGRIELAIAPSDNNVVYASISNKNTSTPSNASSNSATMKAVFVTYDGAATPDSWVRILQGSSQTDPLSNGGSIASGDYAHVLIVNPINPNQVFLGGFFFYVYTGNGANSTTPGSWFPVGSPYALNTPVYLHENIHDIKIVGTSPTTAKFYFVTDAGIYRSGDNLLSFQPFYKGFVTGQFNSVSIEPFPLNNTAANAAGGTTLNINDGFIGGTGGNGLAYFSGKYPAVTQEVNYLSGEMYNAEISKILPKAAFLTRGSDGNIYRLSDIRTSQPVLMPINNYTGTLTQTAPNSSAFGNIGFNSVSGTPFRLWENYGQVTKTPDSLVFYNDSLRVFTGLDDLADMAVRKTFTFSIGRPNRFALIDSIAIRTATITAPVSPATTTVPFTGSDRKDVYIKLSNYSIPTGQTLTIPPISGMVGQASVAGVTLNTAALLDELSVTFSVAPFASKAVSTTAIPDPSVYYRVFATIFYKYKAGDSITLVDNSISTKQVRTTFTLSTALRWSKISLNAPKPYFGETNPVQKVPAPISARLAFVYNNTEITGANKYGIVVSKAPLNLNDPLNLVRISQSGAYTTDANGVATNSVINYTGKPVLLEWSKGGTELYFATDDKKLYRVSFINTIMDLSASSYNGKLYNDIFRYSTNSPVAATPVNNPVSPFRTTLLGSFTNPITSISIANNDTSMVLTFESGGAATDTMIMRSTGNIRKCDFSNVNFTVKNGTLPLSKTYCSLIEKDNAKLVFVGTDNGLFCTTDITANPPTWANVNTFATSAADYLPKVQVFDIKQQTMDCYTEGMIYVATNGRGIWKNGSFFKSDAVSVNELDKVKVGNNMSLYPNPTNGRVTASFNVNSDETVVLQILDINGRLIKVENVGKVYSGEVTHTFDTSDLNSGLYIVNINGTSGVKRVAKLIVTK